MRARILHHSVEKWIQHLPFTWEDVLLLWKIIVCKRNFTAKLECFKKSWWETCFGIQVFFQNQHTCSRQHHVQRLTDSIVFNVTCMESHRFLCRPFKNGNCKKTRKNSLNFLASRMKNLNTKNVYYFFFVVFSESLGYCLKVYAQWKWNFTASQFFLESKKPERVATKIQGNDFCWCSAHICPKALSNFRTLGEQSFWFLLTLT